MKKFLAAAAVAVALSAAPAHADNVGCGLGAVLLKGNSGMAVNLIATFLNGISANQTFGITTGTSGCTQNGRISGGTGRLFAFMENNLDQFAIDASRGHGETIYAVASIMDVPADKVGSVAKQNFALLFNGENADAVSVSLKMTELLKA